MATVTRILSPEDWKKRQLDNLKAVGESSYKVGIAKPKVDPIAAGIAAEDKFAAGVKKAIDAKSRKAALEKVTMADWYKYTAEIGTGRLVDGVIKREPKVAAFITAWQPQLSSHLSKIDALADVSDKEREDKMLANLRGLKALKGKA